MSMRNVLGVGVLGSLSACSAPARQPVAMQEQAVAARPPPAPNIETECVEATLCPPPPGTKGICPAAQMICPDGTTNCCQPNGSGIYTAEDGWAGIGHLNLMLTHFINNGGDVSFDGRYFDQNSKHWLPTTGSVSGASLQRESKKFTVVSVHESATVPTWILHDTTPGLPPSQATVSVKDKELLDLTLYIDVRVAGETPGTERYALTFDSTASCTVSLADPNCKHRSVSTYNLRWYAVTGPASAGQYCSRPGRRLTPQGVPDPVVFQEGIDVGPLKGSVTSAPSMVTMSCRGGAPATVYSWGFDYTVGDPFYFSAAIHMKRASYCGNSDHYTRAGTLIAMADGLPVNNDKVEFLEAQWTENGAKCIIRDNLRHPEMKFSGMCGSTTLQECTLPPPSSGQFLVEGPVTLPPKWP